MNAAIEHLKIGLHTLETNEPINRNEASLAYENGNEEEGDERMKQADLEAKNAEQFREAIALLEAAGTKTTQQ